MAERLVDRCLRSDDDRIGCFRFSGLAGAIPRLPEVRCFGIRPCKVPDIGIIRYRPGRSSWCPDREHPIWGCWAAALRDRQVDLICGVPQINKSIARAGGAIPAKPEAI